MKKLIGLIMILLLPAICITEMLACGNMQTTMALAGTGGITLAMPSAITLDTQKIVFLTSLKEEYEAIDTWLNKAEDLSAFVEDGQTLVFPESGADPAVYKNKTTDIDSVEPEETVFRSELDVYDTQNYKLRNIYLHALPFDKVQHYTRKSAKALIKQEIADAAYAFAPKTAGRKKVILPTTGGALANGLRAMTINDIINLATECDNAEFPEGRNLVLPSDLWWQLVNSNDILKGQLERQPQNGVIKPNVVEYYGITIHKSLGNKLGIAWDIDGAALAPQGSAIDIANGIVPAALFFCDGQVFRAGGQMEMFFQPKQSNTSGRAYEIGFQHRFKADFQMDAERYSGLIYCSKA